VELQKKSRSWSWSGVAKKIEELELEWDFRKMEWSCAELELHIAGVAHLCLVLLKII
jgi:hypothetical protein